MRTVLACIDLSPASRPVVDAAATLATALGVPLTLLHVAAEEPELAGYDKDEVATFTRDDRARQLLDEHGELGERARQLEAEGLVVTPLLVMGPTVEEILAQAERLDAGWVVVGSHGHGGLHHLLLGSVSEGVVRGADRPVTVVPVRRS